MMYWYQDNYIEVSYHTSSSISGITPTTKWDIRKAMGKTSDFKISNIELALAMGLSVMTKCQKFTNESLAFSRAYLQTIPFMLTSKKNGTKEYLVFDNDNKNVLKDFSKSTRIGEIAQGLNYFYFKKNGINGKSVIAIYDFKYYCEKIKKIKAIGFTPDYVLQYDDGTVGVLESKGTLQPDPSLTIKHGKFDQCDNGIKLLSSVAKDGYVSAISFATSSKRMKSKTKMYILDPDNNSQELEKDLNKHLRYEYSKLFSYIGEDKIATLLRENKRIDPNYIPPIKLDDNYVIFRLPHDRGAFDIANRNGRYFDILLRKSAFDNIIHNNEKISPSDYGKAYVHKNDLFENIRLIVN